VTAPTGPESAPGLNTKGAGARIARNISLLFGAKSGGALLGLLVLALAARAVTVAELGALLMLHAYITIVSGLISFESWQAVVKFGAGPLAAGDTGRFHRLLRFTMALDAAGAAAAVIAGMALFLVLAPVLGLPEEMRIPGLVYCGLILVNVRNTPMGVLRVIDRFDLISAQTLILPLVRLAGTAAGLVMGAGLVWYIGVWFAAALISYLSLPVLALRELARRGMLKGLFARRPRLDSPETGLWRFVWFANIDRTVDLFDSHLPTLLTGAIFGPAYAALFKIARDVADLLAKAARLLDWVIYPELTRMVLAGEPARVLALITRASLILLGLGLTVSALLAWAGGDALAAILGEPYREAAPLAVLLLIAASLLAAAAPLYPALYAVGEPGRAVFARALGVTVMLTLTAGLSYLIGEHGPGWAAIAGQVCALTAVSLITVRRLQARAEGGA